MVRFGDLADGLSSLAGEVIAVEPAIVELDDVVAGQESVATFVVRSLGNRPVSLVGADLDCSCLAIEGIPCELDGGTVQVKVRYTPAVGDMGDFEKVIPLHLNVAGPPAVLQLRGTITARSVEVGGD